MSWKRIGVSVWTTSAKGSITYSVGSLTTRETSKALEIILKKALRWVDLLLDLSVSCILLKRCYPHLRFLCGFCLKEVRSIVGHLKIHWVMQNQRKSEAAPRSSKKLHCAGANSPLLEKTTPALPAVSSSCRFAQPKEAHGIRNLAGTR